VRTGAGLSIPTQINKKDSPAKAEESFLVTRTGIEPDTKNAKTIAALVHFIFRCHFHCHFAFSFSFRGQRSR
jgi:hypothetical protein